MMYRKIICGLVGALLISSSMTANASLEQRYEDSCAACHSSGAFGVIQKGDSKAWAKLKTQKGMDNLVKAVKNGMPQMPAGGLCQDCSDSDYVALIEYMAH